MIYETIYVTILIWAIMTLLRLYILLYYTETNRKYIDPSHPNFHKQMFVMYDKLEYSFSNFVYNFTKNPIKLGRKQRRELEELI